MFPLWLTWIFINWSGIPFEESKMYVFVGRFEWELITVVFSCAVSFRRPGWNEINTGWVEAPCFRVSKHGRTTAGDPCLLTHGALFWSPMATGSYPRQHIHTKEISGKSVEMVPRIGLHCAIVVCKCLFTFYLKHDTMQFLFKKSFWIIKGFSWNKCCIPCCIPCCRLGWSVLSRVGLAYYATAVLFWLTT